MKVQERQRKAENSALFYQIQQATLCEHLKTLWRFLLPKIINIGSVTARHSSSLRQPNCGVVP